MATARKKSQTTAKASGKIKSVKKTSRKKAVAPSKPGVVAKSAKTTTKKVVSPAVGVKTTTSKAATDSRSVFGWAMRSWVKTVRSARASDLRGGRLAYVIYAPRSESVQIRKRLKPEVQAWQIEQALASQNEIQVLSGKQGPIWLIRPAQLDSIPQHEGLLEKSLFAKARDTVGSVLAQAIAQKTAKLVLEFHDANFEEQKGALVGLEMAAYQFKQTLAEDSGKDEKRVLPALWVKADGFGLKAEDIHICASLGLAVNLARHLVNVPGGTLNPESYAEQIEALFAKSANVEVEIWQGDRLKRERMGLLIAVGAGAANGPRLVHLKYRPKGSEGKKPLALVGKGITFDSGGLDIKPSSGMRWMKKDMGGSASALALCYWADQVELEQPLDVYLALAENAVGQNSFHPGDILIARNGLSVEIHNTDAEGRLVLADALDVAAKNPDTPLAIINLATLTGAIKVGLGADIAGLFCNHDMLASEILDCGFEMGDLSWRMPLFQPYGTMLKSSFADMANASDGFAGAITAALFLEAFVGDIPWAHLDIYAWRDSAAGACSEMGGNGQSVQALAQFLIRLSGEATAEDESYALPGAWTE
jgi:leucyl aminopeptidase